MALCRSCRRTLIFRLHAAVSVRYTSTTTQSLSATPAAGSTSSTNPLAASTSTPSSSGKPQTSSKKSAQIVGSIPGGQELKGLGYLKAKPTILAKEDDQYPSWLWTLLDESRGGGAGGEVKVDLSAMTKKQRAKYDRKQEKLRENEPRQIPLHEQSNDLTAPGDNAFTSLDRRQEITKSSRVARRKSIREDNFLRSM